MVKANPQEIVLVLDNMRSVHNTGSFFRIADCAGISNLYLCGTTPEPIDRFGRERSDFVKVSLGAEKSVSYKYFKETSEAISNLKSNGFFIVAIEQAENSLDYKTVDVVRHEKVAFVVGEETVGLTKEIIDMCDVVAEIPMHGKKESLNVTIAGGIAIFRILNI